jgi:ABC-2 type transport system ATP-binding protein
MVDTTDIRAAVMKAVRPGEGQGVQMDEIAVRLEGLTKQFGSLRAVDHLELTIRRGETVALLGPNGAGKTTTISMLLGLLTPDAGSVSVLGMSPAAAIRGGRVGAMLQEGSLMPGVRVGEILDYVLGLTRSGMTRERLVATAGLEGLETRRIDRLSGGQTQRLRFALAIASEPDVLVLDEPTSAMDVEARHEFWASMRAYTSAGHTVLFATHYLEEAESFASRVVIVSRGRIVSDGSLADLKQSFGTHTVAFATSDPEVEGIERLPGVSTLERQAGRVVAQTSDADATVRALVASGLDWRDLEVHGASLDEVFLALVGGDEMGGNR